MTDQEILDKIDATWETMWHTDGQDQWPCDVLMGFRSEILGGIRRYSTKVLTERREEMLALVVDPENRSAVGEVLQAVLARRGSKKRV